jgi:hypothetical protein
MSLILRLAPLMLLLGSGSALAAGKHVHGEVMVNLAVEANTLVLEWQAPAVDVLGFERRPNNDAQRQAVAAADAWFGSGRNMLGVPPAAACRLQNVEYEPPKLGSGHADYRARYTFGCAAPQALVYAELWLLNRLQSVERAQVTLLTPALQTQLTLTGTSSRRVELR